MDSWALATTLVGGIATIAIFSFVIKENPFFRFFEHLFIGIAAGWGMVLAVKNFLWPQVLVPMLGLDLVQYPDGSWSGEYDYRLLLYLIPMAFGLLYYFVYSSTYNWIAKLVIGFSLGAAGGASFEGFFNQMLPQLDSSFKPLVVFTEHNGALAFDLWASISNGIFIFTLLAVMYYFFFSFRVKSKAMQKFSGSGRWLMMVCFGAYFGSTVMARMALLVERLEFLLNDWKDAVFQLL